jgi:hypothetical protein
VPSPKEILDDALAELATRLSFQATNDLRSHTLVVASGLDDPLIPTVLARYAVGVLAGWVQYDATIAARFAVQGVERREEIHKLVARIVESPRDATEAELELWRQTWRDPWIAETLIHALLVLTRNHATQVVGGSVIAAMPPHPVPKRHGLDALAIYKDDTVAVMAIGETKASETNGSAQLTVACDSFDKVEQGLAGPDLRDALKTLAPVIPPDLALNISEELWRDHRCYLSAIVYQTEFDGSAHRPRLHQLTPPPARKRLLALQTRAFRKFFDDVATAMPTTVDDIIS